MSRIRRISSWVVCIVAAASSPVALADLRSADGAWQVVSKAQLQSRKVDGAAARNRARAFTPVFLDAAKMRQVLAGAPDEGLMGSRPGQTILLPTPSGTWERFEVFESRMMQPGLADWFVEQGYPLRTYLGRSLDTPASTVYLDFGGPLGFHAQVLGSDTRWQIDPYATGDTVAHVSYRASEVPGKAWRCGYVNRPAATGRRVAALAGATTGGGRRDFRLAVAAQAEYVAFFGGSIPNAQAQIVSTINRVNQIYERDLSVRLVLIANNANIAYTDSGTDPYTVNDCTGAILTANQTNIDTVIGSANYDIGHVMNTGGGGLAGAGPCLASKAAGCTGTSNPGAGDPFDIDYVAHEIGHQFGADHTFESEQGACGGGNRADDSAYEPGSGVTIMAYAGICGAADNVLNNSIAVFHTRSLDQMLDFVAHPSVSCEAVTAGVNPNAPTVSVTGGPFTIPRSTPFELVANSGADADGDSLTYSWEQFDLSTGASGTSLAAGDTGSNPLFRSYLPVSTTTRVFPATALTAGAVPKGEILPTTTRALNFRVIARDNRAGGGRVGETTLLLNVDATKGPFAVTFPNGGQSINGLETVTWNVAGTTDANVEIRLSTDGGATYPIVLAASTPNDGSEQVNLGPNLTSSARIKVKAVGNVYFDVSDADFTINALPVELEEFGIE